MESIKAAVGIDIGSQNTVIAAVMKGGIDIILNESSTRTSPTLVAYTKEERLAGTPALNQIKANFRNTVPFANRMLGIPFSSSQTEIEQRYISNKIIEADGGRKVAYEIKTPKDTLQLYPQQVMGCFFKKIRNFLLNKGIQSQDVVVTVPGYFSAIERQAMIDAINISGLNLLKLLNESSAITYSYGLFRKDDFTSKPRYVVFVDLGHAKLTVTVASFVKEKGKILAEVSNRNVGARNFDAKLMNVLSDRFQSQFDLDPRGSPKCRLRMLDVIEKGRKILSGNQEADFTIECLMEDEDLSEHITRQEFESLIADELAQIQKVFEDAFTLSGLKKDQIHSVELVGDATRIPKIIELASAYFDKAPSRTLNSSECIARGAAIQSAMLSPLFKVSPFNLYDYNPFDVTVSWSLTAPDEEGRHAKEKVLFKKGSNYPNVLALTFDDRQEAMEVVIKYTNPSDIIEGLPDIVGHYKIPNLKPKKEKFAMVVKVTVDINGIPRLQMSEMVETYQQEKKVPIKPMPKETKKEEQPKKEGESEQKDEKSVSSEKTSETEQKKEEIQYETKIIQKSDRTKIRFDYSEHGLDDATLKLCQEAEQKMFTTDQEIIHTKAFKNNLEAYVYDMRSKVGEGELAPYTKEDIAASYIQKLNATEVWLYGEGKNTTLEEYQKKSAELHSIGDDISHRFYLFQQLEFELADIDSQVLKARQSLQAIPADSHITQEEKQKGLEHCQGMTEKMQRIHNALQQDRKQTPKLELREILQWKESFDKDVKAIVNKPKPPPPKKEEPEKKDETKDETKDEKKDEKKTPEQQSNGAAEDISKELD